MIFRNTVANFLGQIIHPIISILLVPFYIHYLGLEGYGLVGFFSALTVLLGIFTKGLGSALQREFARRDGDPSLRVTMPNLLKTFEIVYWAIGGVLGAGLVLFSGFISVAWLRVEMISPETVRTCLLLISLTIAASFPNSVYQAIFVGTQKQVLGNILNSTSALLQAVLSVVVIWIWKSIIGYYVVGLCTAILLMLTMRLFAYRTARSTMVERAIAFDWDELKSLWKISFELILTNGAGLILAQTDRLVISYLLPVSSLGTYNVGVAGGRLLDSFYAPFLTAVYPRTCQMTQSGDSKSVGDLIARNIKVMLLICLTIGLPLSFFAPEVLSVWTNNSEVVTKGAPVLSVYVFGYIFLSLSSVLYQVLIARGQVNYGVWFNSLALVWYPCLMWILVGAQGIVGAAWTWLLYCAGGLVYQSFILSIKERILVGSLLRTLSFATVLSFVENIGISFAFRWSANYFFPNLLWGRVLWALLNALVVALMCYIQHFRGIRPRDIFDLGRVTGNIR
ncbi:MAG: oligosaccharide flippase family protein [Anaerolineales bacterium]